MTAQKITREAWLRNAVEAMRPRFVEVGLPIPDEVHVSVGFGFGSKAESKNILGQTWARRASADSINHIFISPEVNDTAEVLAILLHELIHAADDCANGHRGAFAEAATRLGLTGPMTATTASLTLAAEFIALAATLGHYPHGALTAATLMRTRQPVPAGAIPGGRISSGPAKQGTRMLKVQCPCCGYTVRTTTKWLALGAPSCPTGTVMQEV